MAEGISFNDNGTISIPLGSETYTLKRPTTKQLFDLWDLVDDIAEDTRKRFSELIQQLAEVGDGDEGEALARKLKKERREMYEYTTVPWLREAFNLCGSSPLPEDLTGAPSELTDPSLAMQIIEFWRTVPLAQSPRRPR